MPTSKKQSSLKGSILWVDGQRSSEVAFYPVLREKGLSVETVRTGKAALDRLCTYKPNVVVVDAPSLRTSGVRICQSIHKAVNGDTPIILIANPERPTGKDPSIRVLLTPPFTPRKILNRIHALLPSDGNNLLVRGAIVLDTSRNIVTCNGNETRLTPRLAQLLTMLMKKAGTVIKRERLFKQIWSTDYVGDTRTLDVHISWLRKAIEKDPRKPKHLKTIRGLGYRLDP